MLSAAHDILKQEEGANSTSPAEHNTTNKLDCNRVSTGVSREDYMENVICSRLGFQVDESHTGSDPTIRVTESLTDPTVES
jgi:hypothetical protein